MKVTFNNAPFALAALLSLVACGGGSSPSSGSGEIDAEQAKAKATSVVPGTAGVAATFDTDTEHRWVVGVTVANGATVNVEITRTTGVVEEINDGEGPFTYDLPAPQAGLMTFAAAKAKAVAAKAGALVKWEVKPPENLYEVYVRDDQKQLWEIKMSADQGVVASVLAKDATD